jgi:putative two-component system response regulator
MPHLDGFVVLRQVRNRVRPGELFPILVLTGEIGEETKQRALLEGASDFVTKPYGPTEVILRIRNLLEARNLSRKWEERVAEQLAEISAVQDGLADRLAMLAEFRDYRGGPHTRRVGELASRIARQLGVPDDLADVIRKAAPLHDIGKLAIPDEILMKEGALSLEEMDVVKTHTAIGARVLSGSTSPILQVGEEIALYHHEHWDGSGYTPGLSGEAIPLAARITTIADVFDALMHERPYKRAWTLEESVDRIEELSGSKFDPAVVEAFTKVVSLEGLPLMEMDAEMQELALPFERHFRRVDAD